MMRKGGEEGMQGGEGRRIGTLVPIPELTLFLSPPLSLPLSLSPALYPALSLSLSLSFSLFLSLSLSLSLSLFSPLTHSHSVKASASG